MNPRAFIILTALSLAFWVSLSFALAYNGLHWLASGMPGCFFAQVFVTAFFVRERG